MNDIEKRARELLKAECPGIRDEAFEYGSMMTVVNLHVVMRALRAALTPSEGYVATPEDPSPAMTAAGQLFGLTPNQACAVYQSMLAARPEVSQ